MLIQNQQDWRTRLNLVVQTMREMSTQTDPQEMVRAYGDRMRDLVQADGMVAVSRRDLEPPRYRITRSTRWPQEVNPWEQKDDLPIFDRGLLGELIYADEPAIIDELELSPDDPAHEHLAGYSSAAAIPVYDKGAATNMVIQFSNKPGAFAREGFPEAVWLSNLFGRATHNLVLSNEVREAYDALDRELRIVADIQRSLLPEKPPEIPTLQLATFYQASQFAGGDYYDFFPLAQDKWGILIADVSGHGTPAAVLMAILHSLAHSFPSEPARPASALLNYVNERLAERYTRENGTFVTAFYGVFDPRERTLQYSSAGHPPTRVKRCDDGFMFSLEEARSLPLGILPDAPYEDAFVQLQPGDQMILYTDGVTEAMNDASELFGVERLDEALENCMIDASGLIDAAVDAMNRFTGERAPDDDRTMVVAKIR